MRAAGSASRPRSTRARADPFLAATFGRLRARAEFLRVRTGSRCVAPGFILEARARVGEPKDGASAARFGYTASRKIGGAVVRNRARRRLKEAVRLAAGPYARPDFDYVLIARVSTVQRRFADLVEDLRLAFDKVHRSRGRQNALSNKG